MRTKALLLLLALLAPPAAAAPLDADLTDGALDRREVAVLSVGNGRLRFVDADRNADEASLGGVVRLAFGEPEPDAAAGRLVLTDGQTLAGEVAATAAEEPDALRWRHPRLGERDVPLERVSVLEMPGSGAGPVVGGLGFPVAPGADEVVLRNGDTLRGFVAGVTPGGVTLEPDAGGPAGTFPWEAVARLRLANPPAAPAAGDLIGLRDGSRVAVEAARFDGAAWTLEPPGGEAVGFPAEEVTALEPGASGLRRLTLGTLLVEEPQPADVFGVGFPAARDGAREHLRLHAPTSLRLAVPGGGAPLLAARLRLTLEPEAAASPLSSVDAALGGGEPVRLDATSPTAELRAKGGDGGDGGAGGAGSILLVLDEAEHGPVLDRVLLDGVEVLVDLP